MKISNQTNLNTYNLKNGNNISFGYNYNLPSTKYKNSYSSTDNNQNKKINAAKIAGAILFISATISGGLYIYTNKKLKEAQPSRGTQDNKIRYITNEDVKQINKTNSAISVIGNKLRYFALEYYKRTCSICHKTRKAHPEMELDVFHRVSPRNGGETVLSNIMIVCKDCKHEMHR